jgi:thioredoxin 1
VLQLRMECLLMRATYFTASWCAPCKTFRPIASSCLSGDGIDFQFVDVDVDPALAAGQHVMSLPTIVFYDDDDKELSRVSGASEKMLRNTVRFLTDSGY